MPAFKRVRKEQQIKKLTDETIEKICNNLRLGHYLETAIVMAGVGKTTYYQWIKFSYQRKNSKNKFTQLRNAVEKAMAEAETRDLLVIDKCANGQDVKFLRDDDGNLILNDKGNPIILAKGIDPDWHAAAWRLERRQPNKWGPKSTLALGEEKAPDQDSEQERFERKMRIEEKLKKLKIIDGRE